MPTRTFNPTLKSYYLDTSTFSYAHLAATGASPTLFPAGSASVAPWIEKVAHTGNLCVSFAHAAEFSDWPDSAAADALTTWLDALPLVWAMEPREEELREMEYIAKALLGASPSPPFRPFRARDVSMGDMLRAARIRGWRELKGLGSTMTEQARADLIAMAQAGVDRKEHAKDVTYRRRRLLRDLAKDAHKRLMTCRDPEYLRVQRGRVLPEKFVDLFNRDPKAFPTLQMDWAQMDDLFHNAKIRKANGLKELDQVDGIVGDRQHALFGGAHCEVFTCDGLTGNWVTPVRSRLGLPPPWVLRRYPGGSEAFVRALTAT